MKWFIEHTEQWEIMGNKGYQIVNDKFDVHKVNSVLMSIMGFDNKKTP